MAEALKSITVTKGPKATGKVFGFRIAPKNAANGGRVEVGDKPTKINLDNPQAKKCRLEEQIAGHIGMGFLKKVDED